MKNKNHLFTLLLLTLAGTLFSGYLSGIKLFSGTCALNEPCPYFLGFPACYYGFILFAIMLVITAIAYAIRTSKRWPTVCNAIISGLGVLFAGYFTVKEIINLFQSVTPTKYALILPSCSYGLIFFIVIFILSLINAIRHHE